MKKFKGKHRKFFFVFSNLGVIETLKVILKNSLHFDHYYILTAGLKSLMPVPETRGKYLLHKASESDFKELIKNIKSFSLEDRKEIIIRLFFFHAGFKNCYIAKTEKGEFAAMQWLVYPEENSFIKKNFSDRFYLLKKNQVMLQNVFTFQRFRGFGYLPAMSAELMKIAKENGYLNAITYIRKDRVSSINDFVSVGFKLRKLIREYKILGKTSKAL